MGNDLKRGKRRGPYRLFGEFDYPKNGSDMPVNPLGESPFTLSAEASVAVEGFQESQLPVLGISRNFGGGRRTPCLVPVMGSPTNGTPSLLSTASRCQVFPVAAASHAASPRRQWPMMRGKRHDEIVQLHKRGSPHEESPPPKLRLIRF